MRPRHVTLDVMIPGPITAQEQRDAPRHALRAEKVNRPPRMRSIVLLIIPASSPPTDLPIPLNNYAGFLWQLVNPVPSFRKESAE